MAKKGDRIQVKLKSTESPHLYYTMKKKKKNIERLELKKYDPVIRKIRYTKQNKTCPCSFFLTKMPDSEGVIFFLCIAYVCESLGRIFLTPVFLYRFFCFSSCSKGVGFLCFSTLLGSGRLFLPLS